MMTATSTDRIEKKILLHAPRSRVWRALTDAQEFGQWFGAILDRPFAANSRVTGRITHPGYEHVPFDITIERIEPERLIAWRWRPDPVDTARDYSHEPTTLVQFELEEVEGGTQLTVVESGFDQIPRERREQAYRGNEQGWTGQMNSIRNHVGRSG
jgi:uncharacterized protein YndB with AHSA1/START domain